MNKTKNTVVGKGKGDSKLVRTRFEPGMLLEHEDLNRLNTYTRELSRLMIRSLFGCGVICGLTVKADLKCGKLEVTVESGVALACSGDPVYVPKVTTFMTDDSFDPNSVNMLWVALCGTVNRCAPRASVCSDDDDQSPTVFTQEKDGFEIRVMSDPCECFCGASELQDSQTESAECKCIDRKCVDPELPLYADHYGGKCGCNCDKCSDCDCNCILLARLDKTEDNERPWRADHRARRFVRPVLMRDPQVAIEEEDRKRILDALPKLADEKKIVEEQGRNAAGGIKPREEESLMAAVEKDRVQTHRATEEKSQKEVQKTAPKKR
jgi:hypothetical protein